MELTIYSSMKLYDVMIDRKCKLYLLPELFCRKKCHRIQLFEIRCFYILWRLTRTFWFPTRDSWITGSIQRIQESKQEFAVYRKLISLSLSVDYGKKSKLEFAV